LNLLKTFFVLAALMALPTSCLYGQQWNSSELPHYRPEQRVSGTIRLWGHGSFKRAFMGRLVKYWGEGFARYQPDVKLDIKTYGTASSTGALYAGTGDVAIRGEEIFSFEIAAFERAMHYPPFGIDIATGSLDVQNMDYAQMFFVHKNNPIAQLTLAQLDAIYGYEHQRGLSNIRTWGELGLTGEWADKPIDLYGWRIDDDFSTYLQNAVLAGSHRWNCALKEFARITNPNGTVYEAGQQILDAVAKDRYGIGVSNLRYSNPQVKPLALASQAGGSYYAASQENLISRRYPLTRIIPAFINRVPGQPVDPKVKEFLRYILSREGQEDIVRDGGYLPLNKEAIREQLKKLD